MRNLRRSCRCGKPFWIEGKNERSRRVVLLDGNTLRALKTYRVLQLHEPLAAGSDRFTMIRLARRKLPIECPRATSIKPSADWLPRREYHGSPPTAFATQPTHIVRQAADAGELRAVADVLGHWQAGSQNLRALTTRFICAVTDRIASRVGNARVSGSAGSCQGPE
jgi:hypothetical protein